MSSRATLTTGVVVLVVFYGLAPMGWRHLLKDQPMVTIGGTRRSQLLFPAEYRRYEFSMRKTLQRIGAVGFLGFVVLASYKYIKKSEDEDTDPDCQKGPQG